jgi:hypothetical protein
MPSVGSSKGKSKDTRPARARYWQRGKLADHKVSHLMQSNGMTRKAAYAMWVVTRTTRIKGATKLEA